MAHRRLEDLRQDLVAAAAEQVGMAGLEVMACTVEAPAVHLVGKQLMTEELEDQAQLSLISRVELLSRSFSLAAQATRFQPVQLKSRSGRSVRVVAEVGFLAQMQHQAVAEVQEEFR